MRAPPDRLKTPLLWQKKAGGPPSEDRPLFSATEGETPQSLTWRGLRAPGQLNTVREVEERTAGGACRVAIPVLVALDVTCCDAA